MKRLLIFLLISVSTCTISHSQTFYDMLRTCVDSTFTFVLQNIDNEYNVVKEVPRYRIKKYNSQPSNDEKYNIYITFDNRYSPYGFSYGGHGTKLVYNNDSNKIKKAYICDYYTVLGKDSLLFEIFWYDEDWKDRDVNTYAHNFWTEKHHRLPRRASSESMLFIRDKQKGNWLYKNSKKTKIDLAGWYWERDMHIRSSIMDLTSETLDCCVAEFIKNSSCSIDEMLVFDNTMSYRFFYWEYLKKTFPLLVSSEYDIPNNELKKYKYLFGWNSIELNNDTLSTEIRCVDAIKYKTGGINNAILLKCKLSFCYSDETRRWECVRKDIAKTY